MKYRFLVYALVLAVFPLFSFGHNIPGWIAITAPSDEWPAYLEAQKNLPIGQHTICLQALRDLKLGLRKTNGFERGEIFVASFANDSGPCGDYIAINIPVFLLNFGIWFSLFYFAAMRKRKKASDIV